MRIPFVLELPGATGRRLPGPAQMVDLPATVLSLLDIPAPAAMQGTDLSPWLAGADPKTLPSVLVELDRSKMVVRGGRKLLCNLVEDSCQAFDLEKDPCRALPETADTRRVAARLRREMDERLASRGSPWRAGSKEAFCQRLISQAQRIEPTVVPILLRRCVGTKERREATKALVAMRTPRALPKLLAVTRDRDPKVRVLATVGAALLGDRGSLARCTKLLRQDVIPPGVRRDALLALVAAGDASAVLPLTEHLASSKDIYEQVAIIEALGRSGRGEAAPVLREKLSNLRSRLASIEALGRIRDQEAVPLLTAGLQRDRFVSWRRAAARALGEIGGPEAIRALLEVIQSEREPDVVTQALLALRRLGAIGRLAPRTHSARSWRCRPTGCSIQLGLACNELGVRELLLLHQEMPSAPARLRVQCGGQEVSTFVLHEEPAVVRLSPPLRGALSLESDGGAPAAFYSVLRPVPPDAGRQ